MGQAAGLAAVLSLDKDCGAGSVPVRTLQDRIVALGGCLVTPSVAAFIGRDEWAQNRSNAGS